MKPERLKAAAGLADILTQENAALRRLDFPAAVALLPAKQAALAALVACGQSGAEETPPAGAVALGQQLAALSSENRALLERAIAVQSRLIGIIAKAGRRPDLSYGPAGRRGPPARPPAVTLSASA